MWKILTTFVVVVVLASVVYVGGNIFVYGSLVETKVDPSSHIVVALNESPAAATAAAPAAFDPATYVPDVAHGAKIANRCKACHTFNKGGPHRTGPNQWEVYGAVPGQKAGFAYSDAMKKLGGVWDDVQLDAYLTNPKTYAPGNKMIFAGIKKPADRADLIAWLKTLR